MPDLFANQSGVRLLFEFGNAPSNYFCERTVTSRHKDTSRCVSISEGMRTVATRSLHLVNILTLEH